MQGALFGSECRNSDFRRCSSRDFFIGLHAAALDGILLCFRRRNTSGSRDLISPTSCLFGPAESTSRAPHNNGCLRPEAWRSRRGTACAARNGCAASKTRLTTCQAQTAVGFESPCGQLDRRTAQPNQRRRGHCSSTAGLLSRPGPAWHRCLRDCSGEFIRACLAGEASVHLPARVVPLLLRGVSR